MSLRYKAGFITESYDPLLVPDAPTIGTATAGSTTASVTFTAPSNVGGGAITGYIATAYDSSGNAISTTGSSSPITVTGLTNNTAYTIKVAATNAYGTGAYSAASNSVTPVPPFIEEVFSTYLYTGNSSTQTITNGINLSGNGGLVWVKNRTSASTPHLIWDTAQGGTLSSNSTASKDTYFGAFFSASSTGFNLTSTGALTDLNQSGQTYVSWTFREQAKFFDIVTYTGNGVSGRTISHNLGSVPGCIIVKRTDSTSNWPTWNRGSSSLAGYLNLTVAFDSGAFNDCFGNTQPTSSSFSVGISTDSNANGGTYVAYLFAHDAGGFGATGADNVISCGSYTGTGSSVSVTLGYEPQWVMIKRTDSTGNWVMLDNMRGTPYSQAPSDLYANTSGAEQQNFGGTSTGFITNPTGFGWNDGSLQINANGGTYIYIAIRRGPMKTPTTGTSVFAPTTTATATSPGATATTGFPVDLSIYGLRNLTIAKIFFDRLRGTTSTSSRRLESTNTNAEASSVSNGIGIQSNTTVTENWTGATGYNNILWNFQRAPGFFDVVCYTGNDTNRTINHNLGVAPELIIIKSRSASAEWITSVPGAGWGNTEYLIMNNTFAKNNYGALNVWNGTAPTSTVFSLGTISSVNFGSTTFIAYLFASCPSVSKVGTYTGTGTTQAINCGFTTGARFVMIKRTDSTGDWYVWDSARGIVAGNDPYLLINSTAAEVTNTDYVDASAAGFEISSTAPAAINANGGTFIYLAIA